VDKSFYDAGVDISLNFLHSTFEGNLFWYRSSSKYNNISIEECKINGEIAFLSHFNEITIENTKASSIVINSSPDRYTRFPAFDIKKIILKYNKVNEIYIYNKTNIDTIKISDFKQQVKIIEMNRANIQKKMLLQNLDIKRLIIQNTNFSENSKIVLQNLTIKYFGLIKILQDAKVIMLENIEIYRNFRCNKMNFKNTDFNNFNIEKARKLLRNVSFIDSRINILNWGNIHEIKAPKNTFRALKHTYDSQANVTEANKFYAMEMKKYKEELKDKPNKGHWQEKSIFWINEKMSNFGQNFLKPIGLIAFFSIMYGVIIYGNEHEWLMHLSPDASQALNTLVHWINYPLKEFKPLEKILKKDYEFISLIFNIIFSVLIWQTIVAVKRHTKR